MLMLCVCMYVCAHVCMRVYVCTCVCVCVCMCMYMCLCVLCVCSATVYSPEGNRIAQSTGLEVLLQGDFDLKINDFKYRITVPKDSESAQGCGVS